MRRAVAALLLCTLLALWAEPAPLPSFGEWTVTTGGGNAAAVTQSPQAIVFSALPEGKPCAGCVEAVIEKVDSSQDLLVKSTFSMTGLNPEAVPAIRIMGVAEDGSRTILLDSGIARGQVDGAPSRRKDLISAEKLRGCGAVKAIVDVYIYNFTAGNLTMHGISASSKAALSGHAPDSFEGRAGGIVFNEDCTQVYAQVPDLTPEKLCSYMDSYLVANHQIREMFLNPGGQRMSYDSKVRSTMWDDVLFNADGTATAYGRQIPEGTARMIANCKAFNEAGHDPYAIWIDHLRRRGVSPWISMRMNDCHDMCELDGWIHSRFWRAHPEWRIAQYRLDAGSAQAHYAMGLNYMVPEVREYYLATLQELFDRYDMDGMELDFMRFGRLFPAGHEPEGRDILTEMIEQVRRMADRAAERCGHPVKIAARVPATPENAFDLGYDVAEWCDRKLVDMVVPCTFLFGNHPGMPVELWRRIVGKDVLLAPCIEARFNGYHTTAWFGGGAAIRAGMAADWFYRGADRVYLFNHMGLPPDMNQEIMAHVGKPGQAAAMERRHYIGYDDFPAIGRDRVVKLPMVVHPGSWGELRIPCGPRPEEGRRATLILGFGDAVPAADEVEVRLNGEVVQPTALPLELEYPVENGRLMAFEAKPALRAGDNVAEIKDRNGVRRVIVWCEMHIAPLNPEE